MKLLDRYMSAVAHYLPENRRDEITRELRFNILDQLESLAEANQEPSEAQVAQILNNMGHPQKVANQFLPPKKLVSEELFPFYKQILGYALLIVFLVGLIKLSVGFISNSYVPLAEMAVGYTFGLFTHFVSQGLLAFAIVTGIFYVLSNPPGGAPLLQPYRCWRAEQLPPIFLAGEKLNPDRSGLVEAINVSFKIGFVIAALWLLYEIGRDVYRVVLLNRAAEVSRNT